MKLGRLVIAQVGQGNLARRIQGSMPISRSADQPISTEQRCASCVPKRLRARPTRKALIEGARAGLGERRTRSLTICDARSKQAPASGIGELMGVCRRQESSCSSCAHLYLDDRICQISRAI